MKKTFLQFRKQVYQNFNKRPDCLMELIDALSSNTNARSVAELSLEANFRREYSTLYKGIAACELSNKDLAHLAAAYIPEPQQWNFRLIAKDVSSHPRLYSKALFDRGVVYLSTNIKWNLPVTLGHQYSTLVGLPERAAYDPAWVIPLSIVRVETSADKEQRGVEQTMALLTDPEMPYYGELCVTVEDSSYSKIACLYQQCQLPNLVTVTRVRNNRVFYRPYIPSEDAPVTRGHPCWYGERFALREPETWGEPDETYSFTLHTRQGKERQAELQVWHNLLMRGKNKPYPMPMQQHPFTLVRVQLYREDGAKLYTKALWFIIIGDRRMEVSPKDAYLAYRQRFDIEHAYRFCKQRLLLTNYQTPDVHHEQTWWRLVHLAYLQLWVARSVAERLPRPWERYLSSMQVTAPMTPSLVQRDFARIIRQFGTPAKTPKPRGYSPGRSAGTILPKRERHKVLVKSQIKAKSSPSD